MERSGSGRAASGYRHRLRLGLVSAERVPVVPPLAVFQFDLAVVAVRVSGTLPAVPGLEFGEAGADGVTCLAGRGDVEPGGAQPRSTKITTSAFSSNGGFLSTCQAPFLRRPRTWGGLSLTLMSVRRPSILAR